MTNYIRAITITAIIMAIIMSITERNWFAFGGWVFAFLYYIMVIMDSELIKDLIKQINNK
jgi:hypothetical protein